MTSSSARNRAIGALAVLLLLTSSAASAHLGHEEAKARKAAAQNVEAPEPLVESMPPAPKADSDHASSRHDHSDHSATTPTIPSDTRADEPESNVPRLLAWVGKFHPPLTHFPIALLTVAALAELLYMRTRSSYFYNVVHFSVWVGSLSALGAATLGWFFAGFHLFDDEWPMTAHRWAGTATALLAAGLLMLLDRASRDETARIRFRVVLFAAAAVVGATGFLGGALVYGLEHYSWSTPS